MTAVQSDAGKAEAARLEALHRYAVLDTPPERTFDRITKTAQHVLDVPVVLMSLMDADRQWIKSSAGPNSIEISRDTSFCARVIESGLPLVVEDALIDNRFCTNPLVTEEPKIRFYAGVPLTTPDGHHIGTLCAMDQRPRTLSQKSLDVLADLAGLAVEILELQRIAATDALTGLLTRRSFRRAAEREMDRARRFDRPAGLISFDIDHFKAINDTHGHAAGDAVLRALAGACRPVLRSIDLFARLGGEEFIILLPETDRVSTMEVAERLRRTLADTTVPFEDRKLKITSSFGVTVFGHAGDTVEAVLERADDALYEAKNAGRNRVVFNATGAGLSNVA